MGRSGVNYFEPLSAAILAGGQSRRMGRDKALLAIGGQTLLEIVAARAATVADDLFIVATDRPEYGRFGLPVVADMVANSGSLGGIYTAIASARHQHCLVLACDMPFVNVALLEHMAGLPRDYDVLIPALPGSKSDQGGGETLETMHAIYARSCLPAIRRRLDASQLKVADFLGDVRVQRLDQSTLERFDPELRSFLNANTPEDFDAVRTQLK